MEELEFPTTAGQIGKLFGAEIIGNAEASVDRLDALENSVSGSLSFISHGKFQALLEKAGDAVIFAQKEFVRLDLPLTYLVVTDPQRAFATVAKKFEARPRWEGVSPQANLHSSVVLGKNVSIGPFAILSSGTSIGDNSVIHPFTYLGRDVFIGKNCHIHPQVTIWDRVKIGNGVKIFAGTVIGSDGFGLIGRSESSTSGYLEMPQIGTVTIEDDVRIGAKCTIDRATLGTTKIGRGAKLDNQVHVGHNSQVGAHSVLCAQVGLSGSSILEEEVVLGGQVGIANGCTVGKGARMAGQSGSSTNLKGGIDYFLSPALPMREAVRVVKYLRKLPEIWRKVKALEDRIGEVES